MVDYGTLYSAIEEALDDECCPTPCETGEKNPLSTGMRYNVTYLAMDKKILLGISYQSYPLGFLRD